jgi:hypothetical protein
MIKPNLFQVATTTVADLIQSSPAPKCVLLQTIKTMTSPIEFNMGMETT